MPRKYRFFLSCLSICLATAAPAADLEPLGDALPYARQIDRIVNEGIAEGQLPGAVVVIAGPSEVHYAKAFGDRQIDAQTTPMTLDTVFDLASLTKPIATATSVMRLVDAGKVDVQEPIVRYLRSLVKSGSLPDHPIAYR